MNNQPVSPIDNYLSRIHRINVTPEQFKADDGRIVNFNRLHLHYTLNGRPKVIQLSIKQDKLDLLDAADVIQEQNILSN